MLIPLAPNVMALFLERSRRRINWSETVLVAALILRALVGWVGP